MLRLETKKISVKKSSKIRFSFRATKRRNFLRFSRLNKFGIGPIRSLADVDAELSILEKFVSFLFVDRKEKLLLFSRFDRIQRTIDDRMKQLFDFANGIEKRSAEKWNFSFSFNFPFDEILLSFLYKKKRNQEKTTTFNYSVIFK